MNSFKKIMVICFAVLFTAGLYGSIAFAVSEFEKPPGEPPFGLSIQQDAQGIKLYGVAVVEFYDYDTQADVAKGARVVIRLTKGSIIHTFFKYVPGPLSNVINNPELIQDTIQNEIGPLILNAFFPGEDVGITVKNMDNFEDVEVNRIIIRNDPGDIGNTVKCGKDTYYLEQHENCVNGVDDDNDGLVDIYDSDCQNKISFFIVTDVELAVK